MGEAVADVTELALLSVLLDGVEELLLGDLDSSSVTIFMDRGATVVCMLCPYLLLGVGPAGDLNDHVEDGLLLVGVERDVVEGGDRDAILLNVDPVVQGVGLANLADGVGHGGRFCVGRTRGRGGREVLCEKSSAV